MIIKPKYINNVEVITPLYDRFNDTSVNYYKTRYLISEKFFETKLKKDENGNTLYPSMDKLVSKEGNLLFPKDFDKSNYRLLQEEVERDTQIKEYIIVTETWGYTPTIQFNEPSIVSWQRPGLYDETMTESISANVYSTDVPVTTQEHTIYLDNSQNKFKAGDVVQFTMPRFRKYFMQQGAAITINSATTNYIKVPVFQITVYNLNGSIRTTINSNIYTDDSQSMFYLLKNYPNVCKVYTQLYAQVRTPYSSDFPCTLNTQFVTIDNASQLLQLQPAWSVKIGGQDTDTLTPYTIPTITEYNSKMNTNEMLLATPETLEKLIGDVYMLQKRYVKYQ